MSEADLAALIIEQRRIIELMETIYSEINTLESALREHQNALEILNKYKMDIEQKDYDSLLPIGGGIYLPVNITKPQKMIVRVGAGVFLEKSVDETISYINKSIEKIRRLIDERISTLNQLKNRYEEISSIIAEIQFKLKK